MDPDEYADMCAELRAEDRALKRWRDRLAAHPDPRDPDHPGFDEDEDDD